MAKRGVKGADRRLIDVPGGGNSSRRWSNEPTPLEIAEGLAWAAYCKQPNSKHLHSLHAAAFNALSRAEGPRFGAWRCQNCCVYVFGRKRGQPCGYCGAILVGMNERAA